MPGVTFIALACIIVIVLGTEFINRKPKKQLGSINAGGCLEIHSGFNEDQVILWNGKNGITVDKRDFREEFLYMDVVEIYRELQEEKRDELA
jgi:hypothetical protein